MIDEPVREHAVGEPRLAAGAAGAWAGEGPVVYAGSIDGPDRKPVVKVASNVAYASGHILFMKQGILVAQPFDPNARYPGRSRLDRGQRADGRTLQPRILLSVDERVLAYQTGSSAADVWRYDRSGRASILSASR